MAKPDAATPLAGLYHAATILRTCNDLIKDGFELPEGSEPLVLIQGDRIRKELVELMAAAKA